MFGNASIAHILGDMFIFIYPMDDNPDDHVFGQIAHRVSDMFHSALYVGIMMRGVVAFGDYLIDNDGSTLLGSGITDAASWCERADWIGITLTEKTGSLLHENSFENQMDRFVQYDVPISKKFQNDRMSETEKLWALDWCRHLANIYQNHPDFYCVENSEIPPFGKTRLNETFSSLGSLPKSSRSKYKNALRFYDFCMKDWEPRFIYRERN